MLRNRSFPAKAGIHLHFHRRTKKGKLSAFAGRTIWGIDLQMFATKKCVAFCFLSLALVLWFSSQALAQNEVFLHVVKSTVNAESENAELCLEFDKTLAPIPLWRLAAALRLETNGKIVSPANVAAANSSLCIFPLERSKNYGLTLKGLRGEDGEKMAGPYISSFTVPDRTPLLAFTGENGGVNEFGSYDKPLTLRVVNVARANIDVYRIADSNLMARIWQDRTLTALAPSESAYLARNKGVTIWREEETFNGAPNATTEQKIALREKIPDLAPGLYLVVANAGICSPAPWDQITPQAFRDTIDTNVTGTWNTAPMASTADTKLNG